VAQRRQEIGIRVALGANRRSVVWMLLREAGRLVATGIAIGMVLSLAAGRAAHGIASRLTNPAVRTDRLVLAEWRLHAGAVSHVRRVR
jgi:ABC-type antimicrobial peptide transport system permease subunit